MINRCKYVIRFLRRRIVLGLIFTLSLTYCIVSFIAEDDLAAEDVATPIQRTQPFIWRTNATNYTEPTCRNSIQGQVLLVDELGYVCPRDQLQTNGCCEQGGGGPQFSCISCKTNQCCAVYEYCVACCLHPDKKTSLEMILVKANQDVLLASVNDHFELCLAKCRTNSHSVHHENSYKDPEGKYCYGEVPHVPP